MRLVVKNGLGLEEGTHQDDEAEPQCISNLRTPRNVRKAQTNSGNAREESSNGKMLLAEDAGGRWTRGRGEVGWRGWGCHLEGPADPNLVLTGCRSDVPALFRPWAAPWFAFVEPAEAVNCPPKPARGTANSSADRLQPCLLRNPAAESSFAIFGLIEKTHTPTYIDIQAPSPMARRAAALGPLVRLVRLQAGGVGHVGLSFTGASRIALEARQRAPRRDAACIAPSYHSPSPWSSSRPSPLERIQLVACPACTFSARRDGLHENFLRHH